MELTFTPNYAKFYCEYCDYYTSKKSNFDKHNLTSKHNKGYFGNKMEIIGNDDTSCKCKTCGQNYKTISGLWKHSKKCYFIFR